MSSDCICFHFEATVIRRSSSSYKKLVNSKRSKPAHLGFRGRNDNGSSLGFLKNNKRSWPRSNDFYFKYIYSNVSPLLWEDPLSLPWHSTMIQAASFLYNLCRDGWTRCTELQILFEIRKMFWLRLCCGTFGWSCNINWKYACSRLKEVLRYLLL